MSKMCLWDAATNQCGVTRALSVGVKSMEFQVRQFPVLPLKCFVALAYLLNSQKALPHLRSRTISPGSQCPQSMGTQ